jgi:hypothetical protein
VTPDDVAALQEAQAEGVRQREVIAAEYGAGNPDVAARASVYLRDNVRYGLGPAEAAGLQLFLDYAADLGLAPAKRPLAFYDARGDGTEEPLRTETMERGERET